VFKINDFNDLLAILILVCFVAFILIFTRPVKNQRKNASNKNPVLGYLRPDGLIQVGERALFPGEAKKRGVIISGYYEPSKPKKKRNFWKAWDQ
jgi:hypothetical protein